MKKAVILEVVNNAAEATHVTHMGVFHGDDVFATAFEAKRMLLKGQVMRLCRTNRVPEELSGFCQSKRILSSLSPDIITYDVGGRFDPEKGWFDHHQNGFTEARENGIKYSSFGLLWKAYGVEYLYNLGISKPNKVAEAIDKALVEGIDALDNGQMPMPDEGPAVLSVSSVIAGFNPTWDSQEAFDTAFVKAVEFAAVILDNVVNSCESKIKAETAVEAAIDDSKEGIMVLDRFMPWEEVLFSSGLKKAEGILYVIFPSIRGGFNVQAVPDAPGSFGQRKPLPEAWAGLRDAAMAEASGVSCATFCHSARFICGAETMEGALQLAMKAVKA